MPLPAPSPSVHALRTCFGLVAIALLSTGCPEPEPEPGACAGEGDPTITVSDRGGGAELMDGDTIDVFPPPQGGIFAELDVTIENTAADELEFLVVQITATASGDELALVRYFGDGLPLECNEDERFVIENLPVGFSESLQLADVDGEAVTLRATLETSGGDFSSEYAIVLRSTDF